jgi:hypothetical protein
MPNYGYHFARAKGDAIRRLYRAALPAIVRCGIQPPRSLPIDAFSYSGESALPEQVASIRSLLRYAGRPKSFTIISDGTYTDRSIRILQRIDPIVSVRVFGEHLPNELPETFRHYVTTYTMGRQLGLFVSLPRDRPVMYVDSDVLFFSGAGDLSRYIEDPNVPAFYLLDCRLSADTRVFRNPSEETPPVNAGMILFLKPLDWSLAICRFLELEGEPNFFTNQTLTHLVLHANAARAFDPAKYIVQLDDQFIYPDLYANPKLALRHYVNPVRHKFWENLVR